MVVLLEKNCSVAWFAVPGSFPLVKTAISYRPWAIVGRFPREIEDSTELMEYVVGSKKRRQAVSTERKHHKPPLYKLHPTPFPLRGISLSHHHLLDLHVVAIDEAEHVDALGGVDVDVGAAVDAFALEDAAVDVDHLQGGFTGS